MYHFFSVNDYDRMIRFGILTENHQVELIRGAIVTKFPRSDRHVSSEMRLNRVFNLLVADRAIVSMQTPVCFDDSEPDIDVAILRPRDNFQSVKPRATDALLLIEVSDTTIDYD